jgi:hypothetical protein
MRSRAVVASLAVAAAALGALGGEPAAPGRELPANTWVHLEGADVAGRDDVALVYDPGAKRFLTLGGQPLDGKDLAYADGALDPVGGQWENLFPKGKDWGPRFGPCSAKLPGFKPDQPFVDVEGNPRLSLRYGFKLFWLYRHYAYAPEQKRFVFFAGGYLSPGYTFCYDPAERAWKDLAPADDPVKAAGGQLHWGSMCWAENIRRIVLFGGGNIGTERGDPGTWTYDPAANKWEELKLEVQPPQRANSQLAYDPAAKKVVLFGGDGLNVLYADTWAFDGKKWEELKPPVSPSPRAAHALVWHSLAKKLVLLGGHGYLSQWSYGFSGLRALPLEMWTYDLPGNRWELVRRWDGPEAKGAPPSPGAAALTAAVADDGTIGLLVPQRYRGPQFWLGRFDLSAGDAALTAKLGVKPGTVERRSGDHDPAWYKDVPPADPAKVEAELAGLPANQWVLRKAPKAPVMNMDWGGMAYLAKLDVLARFSGGHCAYSGTAPFVYDIKTDRWSLPFAPELPIGFNCADNGVPRAIWSFGGNPWMGSHTWKHTAADASGQYLVYPRSGYTWFFDPAAEKWRRSKERYPFNHGETLTTMCTAPEGLAAWTPPRNGGYEAGEIWLLAPGTEAWKQLAVKGKLREVTPDSQGMAYDSKRKRLLLFSNYGKNAGDVQACDLATGETQWLSPSGKEKAKVRMRETVYLPEHDLVMVAGQVQENGKWLWLFYDCEKNAWLGAELAGGQDPFGGKQKECGGFNVSAGLTYDSKRKLVWLVGQSNGQLYVLRFDPKTAGLDPLK